MVGVVTLDDLNIRVHVTLLGVVFLDDRFGTVGQVGSHLRASADTYFDLKVLFVGTANAVVFNRRHARTLLEGYIQPHFTVLDFGGFYLDVGEHALFPEAADRLGDGISGNLDSVAFGQPGESDQHEVLVRAGS